MDIPDDQNIEKFCHMQKERIVYTKGKTNTLVKYQRPPQELEEGLQSGPYLFSKVKITMLNLQRPNANASLFSPFYFYTSCPFSKPFPLLLLAPMQPVPEIEIGAVSTLESLIWPEYSVQCNRTAQSTVTTLLPARRQIAPHLSSSCSL